MRSASPCQQQKLASKVAEAPRQGGQGVLQPVSSDEQEEEDESKSVISLASLSKTQWKSYFMGVVSYSKQTRFHMVLGQYWSWWCAIANSMFFECPTANLPIS